MAFISIELFFAIMNNPRNCMQTCNRKGKLTNISA